MSNIVAFGDEWKNQGPESVFLKEFWRSRGVTMMSIRHNMEMDENMAQNFGEMVVEEFVEMAETRGHVVEWNVEEGFVRRLGEPEDDPIRIYKDAVNWLELRELAISSAKDLAVTFSKAF